MRSRQTVRDDAGVLIAGCLVFTLTLFLPSFLNDGDTLWQIRTGDWILDHHAIPLTDPFSFTAGSRPWAPLEWLADTIMALAHRAAGLRGIMVLAATATGLTAAILLHHLLRFLPAAYAVTAMILALANAAPSMLARPHLLAWPCLALWCGGLIAARADRTAPSFWLLPVMVLWINLHGSFMAGLLLPGALMIEALFDPGAHRRPVFIGWARFILAAWTVALINPTFSQGVVYPIRILAMVAGSVGAGEWAPADFSRASPLEMVILGGLALGFSGKVVLPPMRILLLLGLIHAALTHGRNDQLLGIVGVLILAEPLGTSLAPGYARASGAAWRSLTTGVAALACVALAIRFAIPLDPQHSGAAFASTLDTVPVSLRARPVLNEPLLGGPLIFNGVRPFIDSRADLYGPDFVTQYDRAVEGDREELHRVLDDYRIEWTIFPSGRLVIGAMDDMPGWRRLTTSDGLVIHARNQPPR